MILVTDKKRLDWLDNLFQGRLEIGTSWELFYVDYVSISIRKAIDKEIKAAHDARRGRRV